MDMFKFIFDAAAAIAILPAVADEEIEQPTNAQEDTSQTIYFCVVA
jgi:hypothetical protein